MSSTRREFLWTMGGAATAYGLWQMPDLFREVDSSPDAGWSPGLEQRMNSSCLICPSRCGISGRLVDGNLVGITGNPLHPMSQGGVCPRGAAGVQMLYHPKRVASPLVRVGPRGSGQWQPLSREEAIGQIAERLEVLRVEGRAETLALLAGYCAGTMQDLWRQFLRSFGSPNYVADDYNDGTDTVMALMHGIPRRPSYDLEQAEFVLSFGASLFESWWSPLQAFVAFSNPAGDNGRRRRFVQIDTRFSRTAAHAHDWIGIRPGTYAVLALGIAYVLIRDELFDADFVSQHVAGFEDFVDEQGRTVEGYRSQVVSNYRTEEVSAITGVPVERITSLARSLADGGKPVSVCGAEVMSSRNGLLAGLAVHSLNVLLGSVNRAGGVLVGDDLPLDPLVDPTLDGTSRAGFSKPPVVGAPPFGTGDQASRFAEVVADADAPMVEALLLYYANPLSSSARREQWAKVLEKIPFVVSFSPFLDDTARQSDLVLPDLLPYERWQDAPSPTSYPYPVWGLARPLVQPHDGGIHTGDAVLALAKRLGGSVAASLPYQSFEDLLKVRARGLFSAGHGMVLGSEFERQHHREMEQRGWWLREHDEFDAFWEDIVRSGGWTDPYYDDTDPLRMSRKPNGRIDLMPAALIGVQETQQTERQLYQDVRSDNDGASDDFPLRLIPYRVSTLASGTLGLEKWLGEQPVVYPDVLWIPWVEVAPATARALGLGDGSMVSVVSAQGRYRARLKVFPGTAPENVCAPYGLRHPDGEEANPLRLLDGSFDSLTGLASWFSTFVRLERA
ncbi:MAG: molybdopterin-dependent oxidoreductase [Gemmatimonadales bacterium]|jgi:anaerobic selenocysteine-containing dehydrogenase